MDSKSELIPLRPLNLRLIVLADLASTAGGEPVCVDKSTFDDVLRDFRPTLEFRVPGRLADDGRDLDLVLSFPDLDSFRPEAIARRVPALAELLEIRKKLDGYLRGEIDREAVEQALPAGLLASAGASAKPQPEVAARIPSEVGAVEALLAKVDLPGQAPPASSGDALADLLADAVTSGSQRRQAGAERPFEKARDELDRRLTRQLVEICQAPAFQTLEATCRGLRFLVGRTDFSQGVRLEILNASKEEFPDRFYKAVFQQEYEGLSEMPLAGVVAAYEFDRGTADLETLRHVARMGESLRTPFLASAAPAYWGVRQARLLATLPDLGAKTTGPEYAKWNRFREDDTSLWITLAVNRFLLRDGWGAESAGVKEFRWIGDQGAPLWGAAVWALATALLHSFTEEGVRLTMSGPTSSGKLEDMKSRPYGVGGEAVGGETVGHYPLEVRLEDQRAFEIADGGFAPLVARNGADSAYFFACPTFHAPKRYDQTEATRASFAAATLPYQMFAGLASHAFERLSREQGAGLSDEERIAGLRAGMLAFLAHGEEHPQDDEVTVEVAENSEDPRLLDVTARLQPRLKIYGGEIDLMLGTAVPR